MVSINCNKINRINVENNSHLMEPKILRTLVSAIYLFIHLIQKFSDRLEDKSINEIDLIQH